MDGSGSDFPIEGSKEFVLIEDDNGNFEAVEDEYMEGNLAEGYQDDDSMDIAVNEEEAEEEIQDSMDDMKVDPTLDTPDAAFTLHSDSVYAVSVHPRNPEIFVSGGGDELAYMWNFSSSSDSSDPTVLHALDGHKESIVAVGFNHDGSLLASADMNGVVKIWNSETGSCLLDLEGPSSEIEWLSWHPFGNVLLAGSADTTTWMWNASNGTCLQVFSGHLGPVRCGAFDRATGKIAITGSEDGTCFIWKPKTGEAKFHLKSTSGAAVTSIDTHPQNPLLAWASDDGFVRLTHLDTGKLLSGELMHSPDTSIECFSFSNCGKWAAAGDMKGKILISDVTTSKQRLTLNHTDAVVRLKWHPLEESLLVSCSADQTIRIWDVRTGDEIRNWKAHRSTVLDLEISSDGKRIISAGDDAAALIFSI